MSGHILVHGASVAPASPQPGRFLVRNADTAGAFIVVETEMAEAGRTSLHLHEDQDEFVFVLAGALQVTVGTESGELGPGDAAFLPRGVPHRLVNNGPVRTLVAASGSYEGQRAQIFAARAAGLRGTEFADAVDGFVILQP